MYICYVKDEVFYSTQIIEIHFDSSYLCQQLPKFR